MSEVTAVQMPPKQRENKSPHRGQSDGFIRRLLAQGSADWRLSKGTVILICAMPLVFSLIAAVCALIGKDAYKWWTGEDQFGENLQVVFWTVAFILSLFVVKNKLREGDNIFAVLYMILSAGIVFIIGEEISWGQRIFGWVTPETLKEINKQSETNIHNIHGIGDTFKWLHFIIGGYGTLVPIIVMNVRSLDRYRNQLAMLVPHFVLLPYFAFIFIWRGYRILFDAPKKFYFVIAEFSEVTETALSLCFALFIWFQLRREKPKSGNLDR